jgi:retron-type reverse transcriptase
MGSVVAELEHLSKLASADPTKRFSKLYKLVRDKGLLTIAADRVRTNTGGRTAGIDGQTRQQIDLDLVSTLTDELAANRYRPQPVRRVYIPKGTTGRRALGIPTIRDRIVQAAIAQVLEALYEPIFRACSHGFRPKQSTIHALRQLALAYHAGATWIIEGDLVKCFDSIPHRVILDCLRKRIKDERFLALIHRAHAARRRIRGRAGRPHVFGHAARRLGCATKRTLVVLSGATGRR